MFKEVKMIFPKITYKIKTVKRSILMKMPREGNRFDNLSSYSWQHVLSLIQKWSLITKSNELSSILYMGVAK